MEVILLENVNKLGKAYDVVRVKPGYARNFLFPQRKATLITTGLLAKAQKIQADRLKKVEEMVANAKELADQLKDVILTFKKKVRGEKLYGSIGPKDIVEALKKTQKLEIDKDKVKLGSPIKTLGEHTVTLHLAEGVKVRVMVKVEAEE